MLDKETKERSLVAHKIIENNESESSSFPDSVARFMMSESFSSSNLISEKLTPEHIDKLLDSAEKDSERDFKTQQSSKWFFLLVFVISLSFIGFVIVYLSGVDKETMKFVLGIIVGFIGGFGAKELLPKSKKKSD